MLGTLVLVCAGVLCANLPFISERLFGFLPARRKSLPLRLAEVVGGYLFVGALAFVIERQAHGAAYSQTWEFYVVTVALFAVFAFPGFVYRYLWRKH